MTVTKIFPTIREALKTIRAKYKTWRDSAYAGDNSFRLDLDPNPCSQDRLYVQGGDYLAVGLKSSSDGGILCGCYIIGRTNARGEYVRSYPIN